MAEILITLGIIGIVAAMTIPTLVKNYQEKVRDNQFKKAYATLNQALRLTIADFDYVPECYYPNGSTSGAKTTQCNVFYNKFREKIKVIKYCAEKSFENGCIPHYDGFEVIYKELHKNDADYDEKYWENFINSNLSGFNTEYIKQIAPAFILNDGTIIFIYAGNTKKPFPFFTIDINGQGGKTNGDTTCFPSKSVMTVKSSF